MHRFKFAIAAIVICGLMRSSSYSTSAYESGALGGSKFGVRIDHIKDALQGQVHRINVRLDSMVAAEGFGGFDMSIAYDETALQFQGADIDSSALYTACKWEYFNYKLVIPKNFGVSFPNYIVRAIAIADLNNGSPHPVAGCPVNPLGSPGVVMFSLDFLLSNDRTLACAYIPMRFYWNDCGDNSLLSPDLRKPYIAAKVFDYHNGYVPVDSSTAIFPGFGGAPVDSCLDSMVGYRAPERAIDFYNGEIEVICADSIDARGDINLNGLSFEVADAAMLSEYFLKGAAAFGAHAEGSMMASDANGDGIQATPADLLYMWLVIRGDSVAFPQQADVSDTAVFDQGGGQS